MGIFTFDRSCYVDTKLTSELVTTVRKIRQRFLVQKALWERIPCLALLANGRGGGYFDYYTEAYSRLKIPVSTSQHENLLWLELKTGHLLALAPKDGIEWEDRDTYPGTSALVTDEDFDWLQQLQQTWWLAADRLVLDALCGSSLLDAERLTSQLIELQSEPYCADENLQEVETKIRDYKKQLAKLGFPVFD